MHPIDKPVRDVLFRIQRGLSGYVSYLASCETNPVFSEYILYEPVIRILMARGYGVKCEEECPNIDQPGTGDHKKLDFVARGHGANFAVEVKWVKKSTVDVTNDHSKLTAFRGAACANLAFLCVFGRRSHLENIKLRVGGVASHPLEVGKRVYADMIKTKFGCRIFSI